MDSDDIWHQCECTLSPNSMLKIYHNKNKYRFKSVVKTLNLKLFSYKISSEFYLRILPQ